MSFITNNYSPGKLFGVSMTKEHCFIYAPYTEDKSLKMFPVMPNTTKSLGRFNYYGLLK